MDHDSPQFLDVGEAVNILEANPLFPVRKVTMDQRLAELNQVPEARCYGTVERHDWVIKRFEIRAEAFLALVVDRESQNAYTTVLHYLAQASVGEYTGFPAQGLMPLGEEAQRLDVFYELAHKWTALGFQRLAPKEIKAPESKPLDETAQQHRNMVNAYIEEVLNKTGNRITRADIWRAAGYKTRAQFEHWEKNDDRCSTAADQNIRRVLREKPHLRER